MINFTIIAPVHETHLFKKLLLYLENEEKSSARNIRKIYVSLSELGGLNKEHFLEHFREVSAGTKWDALEIEIKKIPYGPEFEITRIEFG